MRAVVKGFSSPDIADLWSYTPTESDCFGFLLRIFVGPEHEDGEESFDVTVVTPAWLQKYRHTEDVIIGRHYLIVFEYNFRRLTDFISSYVARQLGKDWEEIANKISRFGRWEFEDYQP